ncbi:hypothetical protein [Flavobacteriaceae bacterium 14752]|uniref:hypothetical protein n=1 Tax=Mesohalobacter salilacus TaxID=2491711 RepID=UPI000F63A135|nr:hypothetical protein EIG84_04400 [Flavobacteriaceae bacterium 14752]
MKREDKIEKLLEKYLEGKTQLKEEQILSEYFKNNDAKTEWQVYKEMFSYFETSKNEEPQQDFKPKAKVALKSFYKYAAILIVCIAGAWFYNFQYNTKDLGTYDDPELALQETKKVFELIGSHINSNTSEIQKLSTLEETKTKYIDNLKP